MDFLQQLQHFTKGEIQQGKWMIGIAVVLFPFAVFLFKTNLSLQKGIVIPVCLLMLISIAYGGYVLYSKPGHFMKTEKQYHYNPKQALDSEWQKAKSDDKSYRILKYVWGFCTIVFIILYFVFTKDYYKGLSIGFAGLFFALLLIDSFFHQRLNMYIENLQKFIN
ncbi:hypothetical protein HNP38_001291 [Chryseobacterium defluvii]|uniref:Uncharacterized protein n=1 Tax=Chryseobacterium defluvii TaxID=160396 RepID=A0A840K9J8_9FLAO|nr:hypothetical protein [Chryseobacterium defluvii]MBB4806019.1 hypothetical protein [Chryseobacterium defluvii]